MTGCSDDEKAPSQEAKQLNQLSGTWVVTSATLDGSNVTSDYSSFELTLSGSANAAVYAYGVTGRPLLSPWPAGGTWAFGTNLENSMLRDPGTDDELSISYGVSETQLTITFMFNGTGYEASRVNSAEGDYEFTMIRK